MNREAQTATGMSPSLPPASADIRIESDAGIATVWLDRPAAFNALSDAMLEALTAAFDRIAADPAVRVVVLGGRGAAFCAGHDLREMRARPDGDYYRTLFARCTAMMRAIRRMPQPVIARVHGIATAAGCQLVATCDLAVASADARFAVSGVNLGLFCSTPSVALSRNLPTKRAFEMLVTGDFIDAQTALAEGLVNRVCAADALDDTVRMLAEQIAGKPQAAIRAGKALFYRQLEMGTEAAYQLAGQVMACNLMDDTAQRGIAAFLDKRQRRTG